MMKKGDEILAGFIPVCAFVVFHTNRLAIIFDAPSATMTSGRARSLVGVVVGLISLVIGGLALARNRGAIVAVVLGLIGIVLSVVHLVGSTGFGTGGGRAGAIVALILSVIGMSLGVLARARSRPARNTGTAQ